MFRNSQTLNEKKLSIKNFYLKCLSRLLSVSAHPLREFIDQLLAYTVYKFIRQHYIQWVG